MFGELVIALLGAESLVTVGYLMGKLSFQRVYHYNIQIKVLLSDTLLALAAIIAINFFAALFEFFKRTVVICFLNIDSEFITLFASIKLMK